MATVNLAVPAIRAADPNATIIGPATCPSGTGIDTTFLTSCFNYGQRYPGQKGLLDLVDAVSVHPYQSTNGEYARIRGPRRTWYTNTYTPLTTLMKQYHSNVALPIVVLGMGLLHDHAGHHSPSPGRLPGPHDAGQPASQGVVQSNWFDFRNDGTDPSNVEDNFGMVANDFTPKPAYNEMQLLTSSLKGETFTRNSTTAHTSDWLLVFTSPSGQQTLAAWTTGTRVPLPCRVGGRFISPPRPSTWTQLSCLATPTWTARWTYWTWPYWRRIIGKTSPAVGLQGDFNNDGVVDVQDLALLAANYRQSYASDVVPAYSGLDAEAIELLSQAGLTVVPEPGAIVLLAGAGLLLGGLPCSREGGEMPPKQT